MLNHLDNNGLDRLAIASDQRREGKHKTTWRDRVFTAAELQRQTFPAVEFAVPGLIPEGLTIVAGKPKIGKSWLALDICIATAAGRFCLGERKPTQGDVLYAAAATADRQVIVG